MEEQEKNGAKDFWMQWQRVAEMPNAAGMVLLRLKATPAGCAGPYRMAYLWDGKFLETEGAAPVNVDPMFVDAWTFEPGTPGGPPRWPEALLPDGVTARLHEEGVRQLALRADAASRFPGADAAYKAVKAIRLRLADLAPAVVALGLAAGKPDPLDWPELRSAVFRARALHPRLLRDIDEVFAVAMEEAGEVAQAELEQKPAWLKRECADLAAVLIRYWTDPLGASELNRE